LTIKGKELTKLIENAVADKNVSALKRLEKGMEKHFYFCLENKNFTKIYLEERQRIWAFLEDDLKSEVKILLDRLFNLFADVFTEGIDKGQFKNYPARELSEIFVSMITSAASSWLINKETEAKFKKRLDIGFEIFSSGLLKN
jgi:hypothetical protein